MTIAESDETTSPPKTDGAAAATAPLGERWAHLKYTLGEPLVRKAMAVRLLVVGAGGIGCELLKDLLLVGVQHIEVVDLDTIDVSNLNRQFLFRPQHVGQPKALVAREMVQRLNPDAHIVAHHSNIKLARFGLDYFRGFDVVINALDNVSARAHVNRLCLATDRPLVEEGQTTCCYARSEKSWIADPQGVMWEAFLTTGESTVYGDTPDLAALSPGAADGACCAPALAPDAPRCCA